MLEAVCLVPGFALFSSLVTNTRRRHGEGMTKAWRVIGASAVGRSSIIIIPKKAKIRVPLLEIKKRHKWDTMTMTMTTRMNACITPWWDELDYLCLIIISRFLASAY